MSINIATCNYKKKVHELMKQCQIYGDKNMHEGETLHTKKKVHELIKQSQISSDKKYA